MEHLIEARHLTKHFKASEGFFGSGVEFKAVDSVSFFLDKGESLGIVGESGSGKSTVAKIIANIYKPDIGSVLYNGIDISRLSKVAFSEYRKNVQMVFQDVNNSLNPKLKLRSSLRDGVEKHFSKIFEGLSRKQRREVLDHMLIELLEQVGLTKDFLDRYPHEMSGGQRQRISIARAISINPELIIADEPVSSLDVSVQAQVLNLIKSLQKTGISFILISHSIATVANICDKVIVMNKGKLVESGDVKDVLFNPKDSYTKALIEASNYN